MSFGSTHEGFDARDQLVLVKRLRHAVVGAETEAFDLVFDIVEAREDQDRRSNFRSTQLAQHLKARHIRQANLASPRPAPPWFRWPHGRVAIGQSRRWLPH